MHSAVNLADPFSDLPPSPPSPLQKSAKRQFFMVKKLILFPRLAGTAARGLSPPQAHTPLSLSLHLPCSTHGREEQRFQLNTDIMLLL